MRKKFSKSYDKSWKSVCFFKYIFFFFHFHDSRSCLDYQLRRIWSFEKLSRDSCTQNETEILFPTCTLRDKISEGKPIMQSYNPGHLFGYSCRENNTSDSEEFIKLCLYSLAGLCKIYIFITSRTSPRRVVDTKFLLFRRRKMNFARIQCPRGDSLIYFNLYGNIAAGWNRLH